MSDKTGITFGNSRLARLKPILVFFVLSIITVVCETVVKTNTFNLRSIEGKWIAVIKTILYLVFFLIISKGLDAGVAKAGLSRKKAYFNPGRRDFLKCFFVLLFVYCIYLLIFYPGVCNYDTVNGILDLTTGTKPLPFSWIKGQVEISVLLNDHHPIFDTLIFTSFYRIGENLGNLNFGIFLFLLLQSAFSAGLFSYSLFSMGKWVKKPYYYQKLGFIYFSCMPFIGLYVINMVKDSLYSLVFVAYYVCYIMIIKEGITRKRLWMIIFMSVLQALTKKTGVYLVVISDLSLLFLPEIRRNFRYLADVILAVMIPVLIIFVLFSRVLFPLMNIYPGGKQEVFYICFQQTARVVLEHGADLSEDEKTAIANVIDYTGIKDNYTVEATDGIKDTYNFYATDKEIKEFIKVWIRLGLKYPKEYLKALIGVNGGYFSPVSSVNVYKKIANNKLDIYNPDRSMPVRNIVLEIYEWLKTLPLVEVLFYIVLYSWWIPFFVFVKLSRERRFRNMLCMIPILVSVLILIICPITTSRYVVPQLFTIPVVLSLLGEDKEIIYER